jgi:glycosyltransferase involved in cell wall biosynthesis
VVRVLHVVEVSIGGVVSVVNAYGSWQAAAGHDVHVLAPGTAEVSVGERHVWQPQRRAPQRFPASVRALRRTTSDVRPDVVHLHSFFPGVLGRLVPASGSPRPAVVYQPHSWAFDAAPTRVGRPIASAWERYAARRSDALIVNCRDEADEGTSHGVATDAQVVGMPIDTQAFAPASPERRDQARRELGVSGRSVLLCVGRLARQKGQDRLVAAWARQPLPDTVLVLLGAGDPAPLERLAGRHWGRSVVAPGPVTDVRPWLHAADLVVAPSRWESQEVAVAEAMSCGRAVVATQVNGAREAIEDGPEQAAGLVVEQDDLAGLLEGCRRRLSDPALLAAESAAARSRAERMFAVDEVMQRVGAAYAEALHRSAGRRRTEAGT